MYIQALVQITIEDKYSKKEINKHIWKDLDSCENLAPVLKKLRLNILDYKRQYSSYWGSKKQRVFTLGEFNNTPEVMTYIAVAVMKTSRGNRVPIHGAVDYVARKLEGFDNYMDAVRTASELIAVGALSDLYNIIPASDSETGSLMIQSLWLLDESTEQYIADTVYLPPMLVPPNKITCNTDSGYLNPVVESLILKSHNHHDKPLAYDAINIANSVAFELDTFILDNFEETSKKPLNTLEKVKNFQLLKNSSRKVYDLLLKEDNKFWFSWRFDKRGRMNLQGYHVNLQSTEYKKALISLANKETVVIERSK